MVIFILALILHNVESLVYATRPNIKSKVVELRGMLMDGVKVQELIVNCEACGDVKRYDVETQDDVERIFGHFECENKCGRNLYSFITVGSLQTYDIHKEVEENERIVR